MKLFRSHITKIWITGLICCGLITAVAEPANASRSNEHFANWLQSLTKKANTPALERQLRSLKEANGGIQTLLEKASKIISENNGDFNLPADAARDDIQHILLLEWNQYQSGSSMAAVPSSETLKPSLKPQPQKSDFSDVDIYTCAKSSDHQSVITSITVEGPAVISYFLTPLKSGIAIGAP